MSCVVTSVVKPERPPFVTDHRVNISLGHVAILGRITFPFTGPRCVSRRSKAARPCGSGAMCCYASNLSTEVSGPCVGSAILSLQVAFPQQNCTERASVFPPRKAAAPLTAPFERLASKGPAGTANIQPQLAQPPSSPEGVRITTAITQSRRKTTHCQTAWLRDLGASLGSPIVLAIVRWMKALRSVGCVSEITCPPPFTTVSGLVYRTGRTKSRSP